MMRKTCPNCHQTNPARAKFCQFCGRAFQITALIPSRQEFLFHKLKKCENNACLAFIDKNLIKCPECHTFQLKPHFSDILVSRFTNYFLAIIFYSFSLNVLFQQHFLTSYSPITIFFLFLINNEDTEFLLVSIVLLSIFLVHIIGHFITKRKNIGLEILEIQLYLKPDESPSITDIHQLKPISFKKLIVWAIVETIDSWTLFSMSLLSFVVATLLLRDTSLFFISDKMIKGLLVDKKRLRRVNSRISSINEKPQFSRMDRYS